MPDRHLTAHRHQRQRSAVDISRFLGRITLPTARQPGYLGLLLIVAAGVLVACAGAAEPPATVGAASSADAAETVEVAGLPTFVPSLTHTPLPPTATHTPTVTPSPTPTPVDTPTPTITPLPSPTPLLINEIPLDSIAVLSTGVRQHIRQIADRGRALSRDPNAFARIGGSVAATQHFMGRFDTGPYDLGPYADLQTAIDYYAGSFSRVGQGAKRGLTARAIFDPTWSDPEFCQPNETVLDCELRLQNPSVIFIVLGTNDIGNADEFEANTRLLVAKVIEQGIVPILATKADRYEGSDDRNNAIIRQLAADLRVPLWDFDLIAGTIPGRGMGSDNVHLTLYDQYDYTVERALQRGYGVYNLTALMMLDAIRQEIAP